VRRVPFLGRIVASGRASPYSSVRIGRSSFPGVGSFRANPTSQAPRLFRSFQEARFLVPFLFIFCARTCAAAIFPQTRPGLLVRPGVITRCVLCDHFPLALPRFFPERWDGAPLFCSLPNYPPLPYWFQRFRTFEVP